MIDLVVRLLQSAVSFGTVIMFGAIGEILTEKSGNLNLGVPGIMYLGGISGLAAPVPPRRCVCCCPSRLPFWSPRWAD